MKLLQAKAALREVGGDPADQLKWAELRHLAAVGVNTLKLTHEIRNQLQVAAAALWLVHQQRGVHSPDLTRDALEAVERAADLSRQLGHGAAVSAVRAEA
ncbi:MAG: hypothetical protein ACREE0_03745 [Phenylobacterium sp.]